jgi:hypothetical protein
MKITKKKVEQLVNGMDEAIKRAEAFRAAHSDVTSWEQLSEAELDKLNHIICRDFEGVHGAMRKFMRKGWLPIFDERLKRIKAFEDWNYSLGGYDD